MKGLTFVAILSIILLVSILVYCDEGESNTDYFCREFIKQLQIRIHRNRHHCNYTYNKDIKAEMLSMWRLCNAQGAWKKLWKRKYDLPKSNCRLIGKTPNTRHRNQHNLICRFETCQKSEQGLYNQHRKFDKIHGKMCEWHDFWQIMLLQHQLLQHGWWPEQDQCFEAFGLYSSLCSLLCALYNINETKISYHAYCSKVWKKYTKSNPEFFKEHMVSNIKAS